MSYLRKAHESMAGAESEFANGRYNNCAGRCYYSCFQAAVHALDAAGVASAGPQATWSHAYVQAQFVDQLINRRKVYAAGLRDTLARLIMLRHIADYSEDHVTQIQAQRALRRAREFVLEIADHSGGGL